MSAMTAFRQCGASLVVVLLLLLIMTLLGLAAMRGTIMEERMTANMTDRNLAFQATEAALREGEALAQATIAPPTSGCVNGMCAIPTASSIDRWLDPSFNGWRAGTTTLTASAVQAEFFVEYMGEAPTWPGCEQVVPVLPLCLAPRYRITARTSSADNSRAEVLLQSNYLVQ
jgi:type IV pilus assembly protein PilX